MFFNIVTFSVQQPIGQQKKQCIARVFKRHFHMFLRIIYGRLNLNNKVGNYLVPDKTVFQLK